MSKLFKSTQNEINAVIVIEVNDNEKRFELEYVYDNENIKYDEMIDMTETQNFINELREKGYKGNVKNT